MKKQHKPKALDGLDRYSSAAHGVDGLLQKIIREGITLAPKKLIPNPSASEGSASEPSPARRVSMC